ncbi:MAG: hypothetical protein L6R42_005880 [Xanthoria sp. 1 TBL-2021]|nr:MAG: hypothetical protein L6R42_005880 [Xanthoria sp. 1 TBL-2021]
MSAAKTKAQNIIDENAVGMSSFSISFSLSLSPCLFPSLSPSHLPSTPQPIYPPIPFPSQAHLQPSHQPKQSLTKTLLSDMGAKFYVIEMDQVGMTSSPLLPCPFTPPSLLPSPILHSSLPHPKTNNK